MMHTLIAHRITMSDGRYREASTLSNAERAQLLEAVRQVGSLVIPASFHRRNS
jgi:hypothetical protein